jgi:hypothetical protein
MSYKPLLLATVTVAATALSAPALACDPVPGMLIGGGIGAAIGNAPGAAVGAIIGSAITGGAPCYAYGDRGYVERRYDDRGYAEPRYYDRGYAEQRYDRGYDRGYERPYAYAERRYERDYYAAAPAYYAPPPPVYYAPAYRPYVVYASPRYYGQRHHRHGERYYR